MGIIKLFKNYKELGREEFLKRKKEGIVNIYPLSSAQATQKGNWVMFVGLLAGIIVMAFKIKQFWWVEIILCAGLFNHIIMMLGVQQKINLLSKLEQEVKQNDEQKSKA